jgi:Fe-S-cluster-containing dehydrogenase component
MSKVFTVDYNRCNGCRNCQIVCKDEYCDQPWLPYSEAQPIIGQFWMDVTETVRGQVPWVRVSYRPTFCNHCEDAPCMAAAAVAGLPEAVYRREDGLVLIDPVAAKGVRGIVEACPLGVVHWNAELELAQKCTGCAHLLDNGWEVPRCVDACPTDALLYVEEDELDEAQAEVLDELAGFRPRVRFYNKPRRFIAGTVFDSTLDEVVIGIKVCLLDAAGDTVAELETDDMGDFKFDQVEKGVYRVTIGEGHKTLYADTTTLDLSLGDIDITKGL